MPEYLTPHVHCRNTTRRCGEPIPLPLTRLIPLDYGDLKEEIPWGYDDWSAHVGCLHCGFVDLYGSSFIEWDTVEHEEEGQYSAGVVCYRIEFLCGRKGCRNPILFYVMPKDRSEKSKALILKKLNTGFIFGHCKARHLFLAAPKERYTLTDWGLEIPTYEGT
jgi:hypothetical protein